MAARRSPAVGDALHAVAQQPDDAALEIDAFDAVELDLRAVVPGKDLLRRRCDLGLRLLQSGWRGIASIACSSSRAWFLAMTTWLSSCRLMSEESVSQTRRTSSSARPGRLQRGRMILAFTVTDALAMLQPFALSA